MTRIERIDADPFLILSAMIRARPRHQRSIKPRTDVNTALVQPVGLTPSPFAPKYLQEKINFLGFVSILSVPAYECPSGLANGRITVIFSLHHSQTKILELSTRVSFSSISHKSARMWPTSHLRRKFLDGN